MVRRRRGCSRQWFGFENGIGVDLAPGVLGGIRREGEIVVSDSCEICGGVGEDRCIIDPDVNVAKDALRIGAV